MPRRDGPGKAEITVLSDSDIDFVAVHVADPVHAVLLRLLAETGMRWSATALHVRHVDVFGAKITVAQA